MSKLQDFVVVFDRPGATYAPGETVTGKVIFSVLSPENVGEIRWKATGMAKTSWTESSSSNDTDGNSRSETQYYGTTEKYFKISDRLVGSETGDREITLAAGHYSYPFSFQLPTNIPWSFEHKYGHVRYTVQAIVDRPWKLDRKVDSALTVTAPDDWNVQPSRIEPIDDEIEHVVLFFCCFNAGVLRINVNSGESKFFPGETVELIVNHESISTPARVIKMKLKLMKNMIFYNSTKRRYTQKASEVLEKVEVDGPFNKKGQTSLKIVLPQLPPLNLGYCSIIDANYELVLFIHFSGMHTKITRSYPLRL